MAYDFTQDYGGATRATTLVLDGPEWNDTVVRNLVIENVAGPGIQVGAVRNLRIENVTIRNVAGVGILVPATADARDLVIANNLIDGTDRDAILVAQGDNAGRGPLARPQSGLVIAGNQIANAGRVHDPAGQGLRHAITVEPAALIEDNTITDSRSGSAISVRNAGVVRRNRIRNSWCAGIAYYAGSIATGTRRLVIEHNDIAGSDRGGGVRAQDPRGRAAIEVMVSPPVGQGTWVAELVIRNNQIEETPNPGLVVHPDGPRNTVVNAYDNLIGAVQLIAAEDGRAIGAEDGRSLASEASVAAAAAAALFVAATGDDGWSGRLPEPNAAGTDGPLRTLARARDALRADPAVDRVFVRGGTYALDAPLALDGRDSGHAFYAYPGESVLITGGERVAGFTSEGNGLFSAPLAQPCGLDLTIGGVRQRAAMSGAFDPANPYRTGWQAAASGGTATAIRYAPGLLAAADVTSGVFVQAFAADRQADHLGVTTRK
ncbi:hypothetical protein [Azospirillum argentinense]|uniref:right-handed parallel beta-helix repeat-containing protein n=1 Tax=Azospirillum argentinense TaxID=2970906 RepID=UPI0032DF39A5